MAINDPGGGSMPRIALRIPGFPVLRLSVYRL